MENKEKFDYKSFEQEAIKALQNGKPLEGKNGVLAPLIKRLVEAGLNGEMTAHLGETDIFHLIICFSQQVLCCSQ